MSLNRRGFVAGTALAALGARAAGRRRPNVIFAFADEHRWCSLGFTETPAVQTPHLQRLASEGMQFSHCIANYPVCSPWRAIFMSGQWPYQTGVIDNSLKLPEGRPTIGTAFRDAGYRTGYIGKWHLGGRRAEPYGFERSLIWTNDNDHWNSVYHPAGSEPVKYDGYNATGMTDQALEFIADHAAEPFFLVVSWNPPHARFTDPPEAKKALYPDPTALPWRGNRPASASDANRNLGASWEAYQGYHGHISAIDDEVGRLLAALDELKLADDTIIVYTSDHGSLMGSHGLGGKRLPFEESCRVPFLARYPGVIPAGATSRSLLGTIDLPPTLCALAGVPAPDTFVGRDFSPTLRGGRGPEPEFQLLMHIAKENASGGLDHPAPLFRGVTTGRYTYAVQPDRPWLLYDNEADPLQQRNLIDEPGQAEVIRRLRALTAEGLAAAGDPFVLPG